MSLASRAPRRGYWIAHGLLPLIGGFALLAAIEAIDLDLRWSDRFYRLDLGGWHLRDAWWAETLLHRGGRAAVIALALGAAGVAWAGRRGGALASWRRPALYGFASIVACAALLGALKAASARPCPWDVDRYGGRAVHVSLWAAAPAGAVAGGCFPSAHAGTGFSLFAAYFALRDRARRAAIAALVAALATGTLFGFAQVARGAHFASHVVASAMLCWAVSLALYEWLLASSAGASSATSSAKSSSPTSRRYSRSAP